MFSGHYEIVRQIPGHINSLLQILLLFIHHIFSRYALRPYNKRVYNNTLQATLVFHPFAVALRSRPTRNDYSECISGKKKLMTMFDDVVPSHDTYAVSLSTYIGRIPHQKPNIAVSLKRHCFPQSVSRRKLIFSHTSSDRESNANAVVSFLSNFCQSLLNAQLDETIVQRKNRQLRTTVMLAFTPCVCQGTWDICLFFCLDI